MFLVLEGVDGAGKSTQARLLAEHLRSAGPYPEVVELQEPGGTPLGEALRGLVLDPRSGELDAATEVFLFMAARSHLVRRRLRPALARGAAVVCDRFLWSSVVYQGLVGGLGAAAVLELGKLAVDGLKPTRTFVLDLPVEDAGGRRADRNGRAGADRFERRGRDFQARLRDAFLELARQFPQELTVVDARGSVEEIQARLRALLPPLGGPR